MAMRINKNSEVRFRELYDEAMSDEDEALNTPWPVVWHYFGEVVREYGIQVKFWRFAKFFRLRPDEDEDFNWFTQNDKDPDPQFDKYLMYFCVARLVADRDVAITIMDVFDKLIDMRNELRFHIHVSK